MKMKIRTQVTSGDCIKSSFACIVAPGPGIERLGGELFETERKFPFPF